MSDTETNCKIIEVDTMVEVYVGKSRLKKLPLYALFGATAAALVVAASLPGLALGQEGPEPSPIEVIADAVLIDGRCNDMVVDMGALFHYGEQHGVQTVDILPLGTMRKVFETTLARRSEGIDSQTLCTSIVAREQDLIPGVIKRP